MRCLCVYRIKLTESGFGLGAFFSLMSATFAYEDPLSRASSQLANAGTKAQTIYVFKEMGRNMWSSGKGFARVGALYAGTECCIEGVSLSRLYHNALFQAMTSPPAVLCHLPMAHISISTCLTCLSMTFFLGQAFLSLSC